MLFVSCFSFKKSRFGGTNMIFARLWRAITNFSMFCFHSGWQKSGKFSFYEWWCRQLPFVKRKMCWFCRFSESSVLKTKHNFVLRMTIPLVKQKILDLVGSPLQANLNRNTKNTWDIWSPFSRAYHSVPQDLGPPQARKFSKFAFRMLDFYCRNHVFV